METVTDLNDLYEAFRASMRGSAWKEEPQRFEADFLSQLVKLKKELESREYRVSQGSEFILNERGKIRYVHGRCMRDRVVRHILCDKVLTPALDKYLIYNNGASQTGKGLSFARRMFEKDLHSFYLRYGDNDGYVGFVDLTKFYDNIQHEKVRESICPKIDSFSGWLLTEILDSFKVDVSYMYDEEYASCMETVFNSVKYNATIPKEMRTGEKFMAKSVEIGDQISQNIGIYFPTPIDNYAKIVRSCKYYGRYMDDIYIIERDLERLRSVIAGIKEQAAKLGLFVNDRKTRIVKLSKPFKYLQMRYFVLDTGKVVRRINPKNLTRQRRRLKAYKRLLDNGELTEEAIEQAYKSWMGTYTVYMSKKQINNMKELYKTLFGKEIRWKTKPTR